jgi:pyruvate kinase
MLSGETASGKYPREAVAMMAKIIIETESHMRDQSPHRRREQRRLSISETICESIAHAAQDLEMRAIAVYTETGTTARLISKYRPSAEIFSLTYVPAVCNRANLLWGVQPIMAQHTPGLEDMVIGAERELLKRNAVSSGDVVGIVAGTRTTSGSTNFMRLHMIGSGDDAGVAKAIHSRTIAAKRAKTLARKKRSRRKVTRPV